MTMIDDKGNFISKFITQTIREPEVDNGKALSFYIEAANLGSCERYNAIGDLLWNDNYRKNNKAEAIEWYRKAATSETPYSLYKLAIVLFAFDDEKYFQETLDLLRKASEGNFGKATQVLIDIYLAKANKLYKEEKQEEGLYYRIKARDLGYEKLRGKIAFEIERLLNLGQLSYSVFTPEELGALYYNDLVDAANNGDVVGMSMLGKLYELGQIENKYPERLKIKGKPAKICPIERNYVKALECYRKANARKDVRKMLRLVAKQAYDRGRYEKDQYEKAFEYYQELIDDDDCKYRVAEMYRDGLGVKKSVKRAKNLFKSSVSDSQTLPFIFFLAVFITVILCISILSLSVSEDSFFYNYFKLCHLDFSSINVDKTQWKFAGLFFCVTFVEFFGIFWLSAALIWVILVLLLGLSWNLQRISELTRYRWKKLCGKWWATDYHLYDMAFKIKLPYISFPPYPIWYSLYNVCCTNSSFVPNDKHNTKKFHLSSVALRFLISIITFCCPILIWIITSNYTIPGLPFIDLYLWAFIYVVVSLPILLLVNYPTYNGVQNINFNFLGLLCVEVLTITITTFIGTLIGGMIDLCISK